MLAPFSSSPIPCTDERLTSSISTDTERQGKHQIVRFEESCLTGRGPTWTVRPGPSHARATCGQAPAYEHTRTRASRARSLSEASSKSGTGGLSRSNGVRYVYVLSIWVDRLGRTYIRPRGTQGTYYIYKNTYIHTTLTQTTHYLSVPKARWTALNGPW